MTLPKAELHCHIEGAASPDLVRRIAARNGVALPGIFDAAGDYRWHDFSTFLDAYMAACAAFRSPEDFSQLAEAYFRSLAEEGAIYGEIFISPDVAAGTGLSYADYVAGLADGIAKAEAATGIVGRMIAVGIRHLGADAVRKAAEAVLAAPHRYVTGFGLAGDERIGHPRDFAPAFAMVREAGLGTTAHAGEFGGPESVVGALDHLGVRRIGHGVRSIEDAGLVRRLAEERIVLELCPGSNVALSLYPDLAGHPVRRLIHAGVRVTLNSDDPPFFRTSLGREYDAVARVHGLTEEALRAITRTAIEAAFVDEPMRAALLERTG